MMSAKEQKGSIDVIIDFCHAYISLDNSKPSVLGRNKFLKLQPFLFQYPAVHFRYLFLTCILMRKHIPPVPPQKPVWIELFSAVLLSYHTCFLCVKFLFFKAVAKK